jgi:hypothetical protein
MGVKRGLDKSFDLLHEVLLDVGKGDVIIVFLLQGCGDKHSLEDLLALERGLLVLGVKH